jgi:hypothetical protein
MTDGFGILIDTNAAILLSLYAEACNAVSRELGTSVNDLKIAFGKIGCKEQYLNFEEIKKGHALYDYLSINLGKYDGNIQVWFCSLSEIELLNVFMERVFDKELNRKGIPYRIRQKKPFRMQVDFDYDKEVTNYWDKIRNSIEKHNIIFSQPERIEGNLQDILKVSKVVTKYVSFGPVDLYLYASAIYLRTEIYTYDNEFKSIINNISKRNGSNWESINKNIQSDLIKFIHTFSEELEKEGKIALPEGIP